MAVALKAESLVTLAELVAFLGKVLPDPASTEEDNYHRTMNNVASAMEGFCDRRLKDHEDVLTETHSMRHVRRRKLFPRFYPIGVVTSIHVDQDRVFGAEDLIDAGDFVVAGRGRTFIEKLPKSDSFPVGVEHVQIIYTAGFGAAGAPPVPEELQDAALYILADRIKDSGYDNIGASRFGRVDTVSRGGESITYEERDPFPNKAIDILNRYKRRGHVT